MLTELILDKLGVLYLQLLLGGKPCHESIGYTEDEFIELLNLALDRIKYLESVLEENNVQYTMTDW